MRRNFVTQVALQHRRPNYAMLAKTFEANLGKGRKMAEAKNTTKKPRKAPAKKAAAKQTNTEEAKSRFSAAIDEAKAGAIALKAEAGDRAGAYKEQARDRGEVVVSEAKEYGEQAKVKAGELATAGKAGASDAIGSLARVISDTAPKIDEQLGRKVWRLCPLRLAVVAGKRCQARQQIG